jgi:glutaminyl-peptide cyclotransferase
MILSQAFKYLTLPSVLLLLFISCNNESKEITVKEPEKPLQAKKRVVPPVFNEDSAFRFVKYQADLGPRTPGSKAHDRAVDWYEKQFKSFGAEVIIQRGNTKTFDGKSWMLKNVIASFNPNATNRVLLCAHFDSRPFCEKETDPKLQQMPCPGVNDGASGVGVLMEIGRILKTNPLEIGIDIILFDLEDYGKTNGNYDEIDTWCLGSQYWSKNPHKTAYSARYGILLDMVGAKDATFPKEGLSMFYAPEVVNKIWKAAALNGVNGYFLDIESGEMTDDHAYINKLAQIPCVDILHYDVRKNAFFPHHHKTTDDMRNIDKATLKAVGQTLLEVIYNE